MAIRLGRQNEGIEMERVNKKGKNGRVDMKMKSVRLSVCACTCQAAF